MFLSTYRSFIGVFVFIQCISSCKVKPALYDVRKSTDYPDYVKDSTEYLHRLIWAIDNGVPQTAIDTLKPTLPDLEMLSIKYQDSSFWATYVYTLFDVGLEYLSTSRWDSAFPFLQKSYDLSIKHWGEDILIVTMCLNKLSFYYQYKGNYDKYHDCIFRSFDIRRRILNKNDLFLALGFGNMAGYYWDIGDHAKAKLYDDKGLEISLYLYKFWKERNNPLKKDSLLALYGYMPTLPKTINSMLTSIPLIYSYYISSKLKEAIDHQYFKLADVYFEELESLIHENPQIMSHCIVQKLQHKALYYMQKGELKKSNAYLDTLAKVQINDSMALLWVYNQLAYTLSKQGKKEEALKMLEKNLFKNTKDYLLQYKYTRLVEVYLSSNDFELTTKICDSAYHLILKKNYTAFFTIRKSIFNEYDPMVIKQLLYFIHQDIEARHHLESKHSDTAFKINIVELFDVFNSGIVFLQENNFSDEGKISQEFELYPAYEKAMATAYSLYQETQDPKYSFLILKWSEAHKAISLRNAIGLRNEIYSSDHQPKPIQQLIEKEILYKGIQNKIIAWGRDTSTRKDTTLMTNLQRSLVKTTGDIEIIKLKNKNLVESYLDPFSRINYPEKEIKNYLRTHESILIDYFCGNDFVHATVLSPDGQYTYSTKLSKDNYKMIDSFFAMNRQAYTLFDTSIAQALYTLFMKPMEAHLKFKNIIIIPDGILYRLPFESLMMPTRYYVAEKYSIQYEYSSKLLLSKGYKQSKSNYAGFAPQYTGKEEIVVSKDQANILHDTYAESRAMLGSLKFNVPEVVEGAKLMGGKSFIGPAVGKMSFLENSKDARILHLAMHAIADDENADYSQLYFKSKSGTEPLFAYELNEHEMHSELAILSACNTGVGKYRRGDGVKSLARAFKVSGCKNILMSLWPAHDGSTKDIVLSFLKKLKSGMGKADALREAKMEYVQNAPSDLKRPYYWAGLVLIGDNDPMFKHLPLWTWILIVIITLPLISWFLLKQINKI